MNKIKRIVARTVGNFGVSFFSSLFAFDYITALEPTEVLMGALATAGITTGLAISYEMRKYGEGRTS